MKVRELDAAEWSTWKRFRLRSLADSPDAYGRTLEEEQVHSDDVWRERAVDTTVTNLVAEDEGKAVGIAATRVDANDPSLAWVFGMWVEPDARRRGAARALLEHAVALARSWGVRNVELTVTEGNAPAHDLYVSVGFVDIGRREPLRPGSPLEVIYLRREV